MPSLVADVLEPPPLTSDSTYVVGGGGLISPAFPRVERLLRLHGPRVVLWGVGHNLTIDLMRGYMASAAIDYPCWMSEAALVGVRDYGTPFEWVPCPSCLDSRFDAPSPIEHDVVVFEHKRIPTGIRDLPLMRNSGPSLNEALAFLSSGEIVVTNSYHGAYWALLLGRRVIVLPFGSKFFGFKHRMPLSAPDDWRRHRRAAVSYPEALPECRARNIEFHAKVLDVLDRLRSNALGPSRRRTLAAVPADARRLTAPSGLRSRQSHGIAEFQRRKALSFLPRGGRMLAWGLGEDAAWFAEHLPSDASLVGVEHDAASHARVLKQVGNRDRVEVRLRPPTGAVGRHGTRHEEDATCLGSYVRAAVGERFNLILINGHARAACLTAAQDLLAPGGVVCLHDGQRSWYDEAKRAFRSWGVVGACSDTRVRLLWVGGHDYPRSPTRIDGAAPVIVSYFTADTPYEEEARRLIASCEALGLDHDVVALPSGGSWEANCARKADVCLDAWRRLRQPVLWVDADAVMLARPSLLTGCAADFAVHRWNDWQFASGTIFFNQSPLALRLLERWGERCRLDPLVWDQVSLDLAWEDVVAREPLDTLWLPRSYCQIFDAAQDGDQEIVVRHHQASRRLKPLVSQAPPRPIPVPSVALVRARTASRPRRWYLAGPDGDDFELDVSLERRLDSMVDLAPSGQAERPPRADAERAFVEACVRDIDAELERCRDQLLEGHLDELVGRLCDRQPAPFAIYGAGVVGRAVLRIARAHGLTPVCFVETDPPRHEVEKDGVPVRSPAECRALDCHLYAIGSLASASGMLAALDDVYAGSAAPYEALQPQTQQTWLPDRVRAARTLLNGQQALESGRLLAELP